MKRITKTPQFYIRRKTFVIIIPFVCLVCFVVYYGLKPTTYTQPEVASFEVQCPRISLSSTGLDASLRSSEGYSEGSGMVASRQNPGIYWVHSDELLTAGQNAVWAITDTGEFVARYDLPADDRALDAEDIALGVGPDGADYLYLGAIGDNGRNRGEKIITRFKEPLVDRGADQLTEVNIVDATTVNSLAYSYTRVEGSKQYDSEGLIVDPITNDIYIFTKTMIENRGEQDVSLIFKIKNEDFSTSKTTPVISVAPVAAIRGKTPSGKGQNGPTSAAISFDGSQLVVVNRSEIFYWARPEGKTVEETLINSSGLYGATEPCRAEEQASNPESVTFDLLGNKLYTISEKFDSRIYTYDITR